MAGFYDALDRLIGYPARTARNCFLGKLPFSPKNPLEIGCGAGDFSAAFVEKEKPPVFTLCDVDERMLESAGDRVRRAAWSGNLRTCAGDVAGMAFESKFDLIILHFVLDIFRPRIRAEFLAKV